MMKIICKDYCSSGNLQKVWHADPGTLPLIKEIALKEKDEFSKRCGCTGK